MTTKQESVLTRPCPNCEGEGWWESLNSERMGVGATKPCPDCDGTGRVALNRDEMMLALTERLGTVIVSIDDLLPAMEARGFKV